MFSKLAACSRNLVRLGHVAHGLFRDGRVIAGKNFKVAHLIREHAAYGWSAEERTLNHPQLTLDEVYSALASYADHREQVDGGRAASETQAEKLHAKPRPRRLARA